MADGKEYITHPGEKGTVNISEDVISVLVAAAVGEVEGVARLAPQNKDLAERLGMKPAAKGVVIRVDGQEITADVCVMVTMGSVVNKVGEEIQEKVITAVESMTGFKVSAVNVHITGVAFDRDR